MAESLHVAARSGPRWRRPADHSDVRRHNLALVLQVLVEEGPTSRATVSARTGLTKASVSSLVAELEARQLVHDLGPDGAKRLGRPATLVGLDGAHVACMGAELHLDAVSLVVTDLAGRLRWEARRPSAAASPRSLLHALVELVHEAVAAMPGTHLAGLAVAVPGVVDAEHGVVRFAPNLRWEDVPVRALLHDAFGDHLPLHVRNDSTLAALAEQRTGVAAGSANLVFVMAEIGVGGGIVVDGRLARGASGSSGEIGHMVVDPGGARCACGSRGCWETVVGLPAILARTVPDLAESLGADLALSPHDKARVVSARAEAGDPVALAGLDAVGRWLGLGIANLVNVVNPDTVVLAGVLADLAPWLVPVAADVMAAHAIGPSAHDVRLRRSTVPVPAAARGGALLAAEQVRDDPTIVPAVASAS